MDRYGKIDSKFRFVILASKRAKQLLKGAKPKVRAKSRNPIRLAQMEIQEGAIDYEILLPKKDEAMEQEEQVLAVDDGADDLEDAGGAAADADEAAEGEEDQRAEDIDPLDEEFPGGPPDVDKEDE